MRRILLLSISLPLRLERCGEKPSSEGSSLITDNLTTSSQEINPEEPVTETKPATAVSVTLNLKYEIKGDEVTITDSDEKASGTLIGEY